MPTKPDLGLRIWTALRPTRIDRYILAEVIPALLGGLAFFTFVFLMFQVLALAEWLIVHGVSANMLGKMVFLMMLSSLQYTLPVAFLIAIMMGFGRLSADSELVAMKACGYSIYRLSAPVVGLSLVVVVVTLLLNIEWVPWGSRSLREMKIKIGNTKVVSAIKEGTFTTNFFDLLVYVDKVDKKTGELSKVFIYDEREPKNPFTVVGKTGKLLPIQMESELASAFLLRLKNGDIHNNDIGTQTYQKVDFGEYNLYLEHAEGDDAGEIRKPSMLTYDRLVSLIQTFDKEKDLNYYRRLTTEFWRRYSVAMSPLIFVFLGIGFGTFQTRSVRSWSAIIVFLVIVLFWGLQIFGTSLATRGVLAPGLAMQLPNVVLLVLAILGYRRATW